LVSASDFSVSANEPLMLALKVWVSVATEPSAFLRSVMRIFWAGPGLPVGS